MPHYHIHYESHLVLATVPGFLAVVQVGTEPGDHHRVLIRVGTALLFDFTFPSTLAQLCPQLSI